MKEDKGTILVVDDDQDIGAMLKMMLEYKGYAVTILDRGDQAEEMVSHKQVDLVLMDMLLSGTNGIEICGRLKSNKSTAAIPIMMISAHPHARNICIDAGADDFISKPFEMNEIFSRIDRLIKRN